MGRKCYCKMVSICKCQVEIIAPPPSSVLTSIRADSRWDERQIPRCTDPGADGTGFCAPAVKPHPCALLHSWSSWSRKAAPQAPTGSSLPDPQAPSTSTRAPHEILKPWHASEDPGPTAPVISKFWKRFLFLGKEAKMVLG